MCTPFIRLPKHPGFPRRQKQQSWINHLRRRLDSRPARARLERVAFMCPAGTAAYSSVLMNTIPAKIAGVKEIIMVRPSKEGGADKNILAAAAIAGCGQGFSCRRGSGCRRPRLRHRDDTEG